jgi:hypothetical protein
VTIGFAAGCVILLGGVTLAFQDINRRNEQMHKPLMDA